NHGGEKISPREIDEVLLQHPAVAEAVAFGAAHPVWGEEVAAAVVLDAPATAQELQRHCHQHLADFKGPRRIHLGGATPRTGPGGGGGAPAGRRAGDRPERHPVVVLPAPRRPAGGNPAADGRPGRRAGALLRAAAADRLRRLGGDAAVRAGGYRTRGGEPVYD